ncbi:MAG: FeoA domain-containing protein, partial [Bacteroidales bacterium]
MATFAPLMTLAELHTGEKGIIAKVKGRGVFRRRIMDMGFIHGKEVKVIKSAPLQDPVEYLIMGYNVSLRRSEAELIEISPINIEAGLSTPPLPTAPVFVIPANAAPMLTNETSDVVIPAKAGTPSFYSEADLTIEVALVGNPNSGKTSI